MGKLNELGIEYKRQILKKELLKCTQEEIDKFNRMYGGIDIIPESKMDWAYHQVQNTLKDRMISNTNESQIILYSVGYNEIDPVYFLGTFDSEEKAIERMMDYCKDWYHNDKKYNTVEEFKQTEYFKAFDLIIHNLNETINQTM